MPAEAQGLKETITGVYFEITATALGSKHLVIILHKGER